MELRKRKGITLQALADGIRRSVGFVSRSSAACRGRRWTLVAISQVLGGAGDLLLLLAEDPGLALGDPSGRASDLAYARAPATTWCRPRLDGCLLHARNLP